MAKTNTQVNKGETIARKAKRLSGDVVSTKMKDTIVVLVERFVKLPKYQKFVTIKKRYKAHDKGNTKKEGEKVTIESCRPISKDKAFIVVNEK